MATNPKKAKGGDKKSQRKSEDSPMLSTDDKKNDAPEEVVETPIEEEQMTPEEEPPKEPTPEPVYEEPVLTQLIVESYKGDEACGLYEGLGEAEFVGGHTYKGMFHEGMMHGEGTYTWADGVVYEGTFTQNHVTGKGMYKWKDGSTYEGEVLNGKRHGFGTFRCKDNKMSYTGDWFAGKRHGKGRMEYDSMGSSFYEGDFVNNVRHGLGVRRYPSGNVYEGMWFNNVRHGEGTMRWLAEDQMYTGQWENGIQHGMGQHIWFLRRKAASQYPLRNMYDGEFVYGQRHGFGSYSYANGARYEGQWVKNMKQGQGKFIFKNGRIYEGTFDKDHIVEFPDFQMDGRYTPDLSGIRTRTPLPLDAMSVHSNDSNNTYSPSFQLDIDQLLDEFTETDRDEEAAQVSFVITRHITSLRQVYSYYSRLGFEASPDNTFVMNKMQFWRMLKDCQAHHRDITLCEMDRVLASPGTEPCDFHNPKSKIIFRQFLNHLIVLAYHIYSEEYEGTSPVLAWCLQKLISDNILRHACTVKGNIYCETRRALHALEHLDKAYKVYQDFCTVKKPVSHGPTLKMRQFLHMMQDLKLVNNDLTARAIIEVLSSDDPAVQDEEGAINLELQMTFLEFFEALVGCAPIYVTENVVKDPTTPRPSTTLTQDHSMASIPGYASRASHAGGEDSHEEMTHGSPNQPVTPDGTSPVARASSSDTTHKTADASSKQPDTSQVLASHTTVVSGGSELDPPPSRHTQTGSARKSEVSMGEVKKSASFISSQSGAEMTGAGQQLTQSMMSLPHPVTHSESGEEIQTERPNEEDGEEEEDVGEEEFDGEELDEATRQFNFWTHQVHIFFVRKFFPASEKMAFLKQIIRDKHPALTAEA